MLDLCGRKSNPLLLKIRSIKTDDAGAQNTLKAYRKKWEIHCFLLKRFLDFPFRLCILRILKAVVWRKML